MRTETFKNTNRLPVAYIDVAGQYEYLKNMSNQTLAIFDNSCNRTFDKNRKYIGEGNMLQRFIPK